MKAIWNDVIVAESTQTLDVKGYIYFPRDAVRMDLLASVPRAGSDLQCPHGVQFFDVTNGKQRSERAAWSYEAPQPAMQSVDRWIGFWKDVELQ